MDSDAINSLSCEAERFFLRLCLVADDYGRFDARPQVLKSALFPLGETLRSTDIAAWLAECEKAGLVRCYEVDSKPYVVIPKFRQRLRAHRARFPQPPWPSDGGHAPDMRPPEEEVEVEKEREEETETEAKQKDAPAPPHIPSVKEVEDYGGMHGVPAEYCRHYHAVCSEKHRWLVGKPGQERLIGWPSELKRWWEKDRATWKGAGKRTQSREIQEEIKVKKL